MKAKEGVISNAKMIKELKTILGKYEYSKSYLLKVVEMRKFITEISEALGDKMKHGTSLSVLETSMYVRANEILKQTI